MHRFSSPPVDPPPQQDADTGLAALLAMASLHGIAADAAALRHEFGHGPFDTPKILLAARSVGLHARAVRQDPTRLDRAPLPAVAQELETGRYFVIGQYQAGDGMRAARVLIQRPDETPSVMSLTELLATWTGEQIFFTSRASLASTMAKFDFSWFIPSIVRYRRLLGEILLISLVLQAQTALARARLASQRAADEADKAMSMLVYTLGIAAGTRLALPEDSPEPAAQGVDELAAWLEKAKRQHPAITAAQKQWQATRSRIASVRSQGMPTVDLGVSFYQNGYPNQGLQTARSNTTIIGVTLTIPLFEGFARTYKVREAQAQAEQDEARVQDTERQVLGDVVKAHADAVAALGELDASRELLDSAQLALTSSRRRYDHGVADILEVLNVQAALADAQQERVRSESDWRSARLRLRAAAGVLGRRLLAETDGS